MSEPTPDSDPIALLLRRAGKRVQPPDQSTERVRAAVHAAWLAGLRRHRRRRYLLAAAASAALAVIGAAFWRMPEPGGDVVAQVLRGAGELVLTRAGAPLPPGRPVTEVHSGDQLRVMGNRGVALDSASGLALRVAAGTRLTWRDAEHIELQAGGLYVDSAATGSAAAPLRVVTPLATVQHVGTRFVVHTDAHQLRVAVRDGRVSVTPRRGARLQLEGGEVVESLSNGQLRRFQRADDNVDWGWVDALAPATLIDGRMLHDVLAELARQGGMQLHYATGDVELAARSLPLNGQPLQLHARAALAAVLAATPFEARYRAADILIQPRP